MSTLDFEDPSTEGAEPLDLFEQCCHARGWAFERDGDEELMVAAPGSWGSYQVRILWRPDDALIQLVAMLDVKVPEARRAAVYETLGLINERLWIGHFEMWATEGDLLFRHAVLLDPDAPALVPHQALELLEVMVDECERYYPVFQFVLWAGKLPQEALELSLLDTVGEA